MPSFTTRAVARPWHVWLVLLMGAAFAVWASSRVLAAISDGGISTILSASSLLLLSLVAPLHVLVTEVRSTTVSAVGISWRGLVWRRTRPWTDFVEVGTLRLDMGAGGTWIAARLHPAAPRASRLTFPLRLRRTGLGTEEDVAGVIRLAFADTGRARPEWDASGDEIVARFRTHAGDRWVDDLGPVP